MSRSTLKTSAINAEIRKAQVAAAAPAAPAGKKATAKDKPAAAAPKGAGEIRIIGGAWKRTRLPVAQRPGLRPTPDRVKEALFNILQFDLEGRVFLDLFAGSGQIGLEALSRGAASAVFVDSSRDSIEVVRENLNTTQLAQSAQVMQAICCPSRMSIPIGQTLTQALQSMQSPSWSAWAPLRCLPRGSPRQSR